MHAIGLIGPYRRGILSFAALRGLRTSLAKTCFLHRKFVSRRRSYCLLQLALFGILIQLSLYSSYYSCCLIICFNRTRSLPMSASNSAVSDPARAIKLARFLNSILYGDQSLKNFQNGVTFIEAICGQPDPPTCIEKVISSPHGLTSLQACMRFNAAPSFQNGPATKLIQYIQCPTLKIILGGNYLHRIILHIIEPPIF